MCPDCEAGSGKVPTTEIEHAAGEETQWDWVELPEAPWLDAADPAALQRRSEAFDRFAEVVRAGLGPRGAELDDVRIRAALGAVNEMVLEVLRRDADEELPELVDLATEVLVAVLGLGNA